jgi:hypothetical protein
VFFFWNKPSLVCNLKESFINLHSFRQGLPLLCRKKQRLQGAPYSTPYASVSRDLTLGRKLLHKIPHMHLLRLIMQKRTRRRVALWGVISYRQWPWIHATDLNFLILFIYSCSLLLLS